MTDNLTTGMLFKMGLVTNDEVNDVVTAVLAGEGSTGLLMIGGVALVAML